MLSKVPQLEYVYVIGVSELIVRAAKHLFTTYMQGVEMMGLSAAIAHFLNCFLGSNPTPVVTNSTILHCIRLGLNPMFVGL